MIVETIPLLLQRCDHYGLEMEARSAARVTCLSCLSSIALREWRCCLKLNANALSQGGRHNCLLESVIPKPNRGLDGYDLILASQA